MTIREQSDLRKYFTGMSALTKQHLLAYITNLCPEQIIRLKMTWSNLEHDDRDVLAVCLNTSPMSSRHTTVFKNMIDMGEQFIEWSRLVF